ncbi:hypothetical protein PHMEG_000527 [Phytophthora megakarya]|uniref:Chromo domain-containing protein n=1 Tax=Phytophthora megakarya TaxID=4795 RepID=A0A225X3X1_9STRA|nr:hypothetical protein PHMEG_000527 [Phytophthora megakarya]
MTGNKAMSPLDPIVVPTSATPAMLAEIRSNQRLHFDEVQTTLEPIDKRMIETSNKVRIRGRVNSSQKQGTKIAQFDVGDYVLYANVWAHGRDKLRIKWCGPAQEIGTTSNWIFQIKNLVTGDDREAHASRLKFYSDDSLEVSQDLLQHVFHRHRGKSHVVEKFLQASYDTVAKCYKLLVSWRGLSELEDSWEPSQAMIEDVSTAVKSFIAENIHQDVVCKIAEAHDILVE